VGQVDLKGKVGILPHNAAASYPRRNESSSICYLEIHEVGSESWPMAKSGLRSAQGQ
jgi:hypothetical protein